MSRDLAALLPRRRVRLFIVRSGAAPTHTAHSTWGIWACGEGGVEGGGPGGLGGRGE